MYVYSNMFGEFRMKRNFIYIECMADDELLNTKRNIILQNIYKKHNLQNIGHGECKDKTNLVAKSWCVNFC